MWVRVPPGACTAPKLPLTYISDVRSDMGLLEVLIGIAILLFSVSFHEFAHAYVAYKLGDYTAASEGRLTLNPLKHIDPWGLLAMLYLRIGWARPVPVNPYNFKNPDRDMAIVAVAGPLANLLLAYVALFLHELMIFTPVVGGTLYITALLNVLLALFNLIPIPPLDGYKFLSFVIPTSLKYYYEAIRPYGPIILLILLYTTRLPVLLKEGAITVVSFMREFLTLPLVKIVRVLLGL